MEFRFGHASCVLRPASLALVPCTWAASCVLRPAYCVLWPARWWTARCDMRVETCALRTVGRATWLFRLLGYITCVPHIKAHIIHLTRAQRPLCTCHDPLHPSMGEDLPVRFFCALSKRAQRYYIKLSIKGQHPNNKFRRLLCAFIWGTQVIYPSSLNNHVARPTVRRSQLACRISQFIISQGAGHSSQDAAHRTQLADQVHSTRARLAGRSSQLACPNRNSIDFFNILYIYTCSDIGERIAGKQDEFSLIIDGPHFGKLRPIYEKLIVNCFPCCAHVCDEVILLWILVSMYLT